MMISRKSPCFKENYVGVSLAIGSLTYISETVVEGAVNLINLSKFYSQWMTFKPDCVTTYQHLIPLKNGPLGSTDF